MSADAIHQHAQLCKPSSAGDNDDEWEEENFEEDDSGDEGDEFVYD